MSQGKFPTINEIKPDLTVPALSEGKPQPGRRVKLTLPGYPSESVYHVLYLPTNWEKGKQYPVLVEYAGNGPYRSNLGDISEGIVEGSKLGYGISQGKDFIWLCLPYLDDEGKSNVKQWWGTKPKHDPQPTVDYCLKALDWVCKEYGGDPERLILSGFSRGAIACNFIGLQNDEIARRWKGFIVYSHYDGVFRWGYPGSSKADALIRLKRLKERPQIILHEETGNSRGLAATKKYLEETGVSLDKLTFLSTGFRNHNDAWVLRPSEARDAVRTWTQKLIR